MSSSATIRQVIFSPAEYFKQTTTVTGVIVLLDRDLGRIDITDDGAKLIVEVGHVTTAAADLLVGSRVLITGRVKKQQRRTFLEAHAVVKLEDDGDTTLSESEAQATVCTCSGNAPGESDK